MKFSKVLKKFIRILLEMPGDKLPDEIYYVFIDKYPVRQRTRSMSGPQITILDLESLNFKPASRYQEDEVHLGRNGEMDEITREEFINLVETIRSRYYLEDDEISAIYRKMIALEDNAKSEDRELTEGEKKQLSVWRHETYTLFAEKYSDV